MPSGRVRNAGLNEADKKAGKQDAKRSDAIMQSHIAYPGGTLTRWIGATFTAHHLYSIYDLR